MNVTQRINSIQEIQDAIKQQLESNVYFKSHKITVLTENSLDIMFQIKNAIAKLGICCVVQTPTFEFYGKDADGHPVWTMPEFSVVVTEIPTINRARAGASTALDAALMVAETMNELGSEISLSTISQTETEGYVSVFVTFQSSAHFGYERKNLS